MSYSLIKSVAAFPPNADGSRQKLEGEYLSPSQVKAFERCESAYYAAYAKGRREPGKPKLLLGTAFHRFAEVFHQRQMAGFSSQDAATVAYEVMSETIESEIAADKLFRWGEDLVWYKGAKFTKDSLHARARTAAALVLPTLEKYEPIRLEQGYVIHWSDGITLPILAFTDLIARNRQLQSKPPLVIDYKTSGQAKAEFDLLTDLALTAYSIGEGLTTGGTMIENVGYINIVTTKEMQIQELFDRRFEDDIRRLYNAARVQTLKIRAGLIGMTQSKQNCGSCYQREWCVEQFGGVRPEESAEEAAQADADANYLEVITPAIAA